jgi:CheY-like chemotaxis protein
MHSSSSDDKYSVLIVDDNESVREVLTTMLSRRGYRCESASNGIEAMRKVKQSNFDAVITDLMMPEMDGMVLMRELRRHFSDLPVMVMTGCPDDSVMEMAISAGAKDLLWKPFKISELTMRLQRMLHVHKLAGEQEA